MDYSKLRTVTIQDKVEDVAGLFRDLRAALFAVVNVGMDERGTHLYFEPTERKDPRPIVQAWVGRKLSVQKPTTSFLGRLFRKMW